MATLHLNYELLGDSQFVRFLAEIKKVRPRKNEKGCNYIKLCVSGQGIQRLTDRAQMAPPQHRQVLILIGTNDIRRGVPIRKFKIQLRQLQRMLRDKEVVFLTIPPIPYYARDDPKTILWDKYNAAIKKLHDCRILDIVPIFRNESGIINQHYFERFYYKTGRRYPDLVHLSASGFRRLNDFFIQNLNSVPPTHPTPALT